MGKTNEKQLRFELKAECVNDGIFSKMEVSVKGRIKPADKLLIIARTFDAMVKNDRKHDRAIIAGMLYQAMKKDMTAEEYLNGFMRCII